jgi:hypothetical protein
MDRSGRDSVQTFERGMGDVVLTYENEIVVGQRAGRRYDQVTPHSTLRIDNPAALVDVYVDQHGRRELAEAFLEFLRSPEAQRIFADSMERFMRLLRGEVRGVPAQLREFAHAAAGYYHGLRYCRGGDTMGYVFMSEMFRRIFGVRLSWKSGTDFRAWYMTQDQFIEWFLANSIVR